MITVGLDVGSTTIKCVVLNEENRIIYQNYRRHMSQIAVMTVELLREIQKCFPEEKQISLAVSGTDCVIELGGEDAKIIDQMATLLGVDLPKVIFSLF